MHEGFVAPLFAGAFHPRVGLQVADDGLNRSPELLLSKDKLEAARRNTRRNVSTNAELKQEIVQIKRRISSLERALDSILTKDDLKAIEEARRDLAHGRTVPLSSAKKKGS